MNDIPLPPLVIVASAIALGGSLLLLWAGVEHARHFRRLRAVLVAQALVPYRLHRTAAGLLVVAELVGGVAGPVAVGLGVPLGFAVVFFVYAGLAGYAGTLLRSRPSAPCGCFGNEAVSPVIVLRALVFAVAAAIAAMTTAMTTATPQSIVPWLTLVGAASVVALLARLLPAATSATVETRSR